MRATSMRRLVGGAAALMLVGATLLTATGTALAAKPVDGTRHLYVGPDSSFKADLGLLTFVPVSAGGQSASTVYVKNVDNQTLTHVVITFARQQGGTSVSQIYGTGAGACLPLGATTITCDFGNLNAGATSRFTLVIDTTVVETFDFKGTIVFNESNNPNGGNPQISEIKGSLGVTTTTCNSLATFVPPGIAKRLPADTSGCSGDPQHSALGVPANADGNIVSLNDDTLATGCGAYTCLGYAADGNVNGGVAVSPYLTWYITYPAATIGNLNPKLVGFQHGNAPPILQKKGTCGAVFVKDCVVGYTVDASGNVTFEIRTTGNGLIKGLH
jgi:hypothetical protein